MLARTLRVMALVIIVPLLVATRYQAELLPESVVAYHASDGRDRWSGRAPISSLQLTFDETRLSRTRLVVVVEPAQFNSGNFIRDANARRAVFNTDTYPTITFTATAISADPDTLPSGATRQLLVRGTLAMHGVERGLELPVTVSRDGNRFRASGEFSVLLSDFGMTRPRFFTLVVDDLVRVSFEVHGTLTPLGP